MSLLPMPRDTLYCPVCDQWVSETKMKQHTHNEDSWGNIE